MLCPANPGEKIEDYFDAKMRNITRNTLGNNKSIYVLQKN
jgi:hypothetical protein